MNKTLCWVALALAGIASPVFAETEASTAEAEKIARGLLMQHGDRLILAPCRERSYVKVDDGSVGGAVAEALARLGLAEGKPLYVEFMGRAAGPDLLVTAINYATPEARCQQLGGAEENWRAAGKDGAWSLVIGGGQLRLSREGKPDYLLPVAGVREEAAQAEFAVSEAPGLRVRFSREACPLPGGRLTGWQAQVEVEGGMLQGCAWQR